MNNSNYTHPREYEGNYGGGGTVFKGVVEFLLVVVIIGALLGFAFSRTELLNPSFAAEQARRMSAETSALEARTAYEQQQRDAAIERQKALMQQDLVWRQRWAETVELAVSLIVLALAAAIAAAGFGGGAYLVCVGIVRLQKTTTTQSQAVRPRAKIIPFPSGRIIPSASTPGIRNSP